MKPSISLSAHWMGVTMVMGKGLQTGRVYRIEWAESMATVHTQSQAPPMKAHPHLPTAQSAHTRSSQAHTLTTPNLIIIITKRLISKLTLSQPKIKYKSLPISCNHTAKYFQSYSESTTVILSGRPAWYSHESTLQKTTGIPQISIVS